MSSSVFSQSFSKSKAAGEDGDYLLGDFSPEDLRQETKDDGDSDSEKERELSGGDEEGEGPNNETEEATNNESCQERARERENRDIKIEVREEVDSQESINLEEAGGIIEKKTGYRLEEKQALHEEGQTTEFCHDDKYASLAEPESSDDEKSEKEDKEETLSIHENFDSQGCKRRCFEILDEKMEARKRSSSHSFVPLQDLVYGETEAAKTFDETFSTTDLRKPCRCHGEPDESKLQELFHGGSLHSLNSNCEDPLRSKHSLTLDLECRICHDTEGQDLISPCHCAGTSKWVHESCIIRWIRYTKTRQCEICTCPITVKRKKKPIDQWTRPTASCGPCNKLDIWYCFVLVLCVLIIVAFVVLQYRYDVSDQIETTVIFASIYVLCGMIIMIKVRYFWTWFVQRSSFWGNWKNLNEEWRIIEAREAQAIAPQSPV